MFIVGRKFVAFSSIRVCPVKVDNVLVTQNIISQKNDGYRIK